MMHSARQGIRVSKRRMVMCMVVRRDRGSAATVTGASDKDAEDLPKPRPFNEIPKPKFAFLDYSPLGSYGTDKLLEACLDRYRKLGKIWIEKIGTINLLNIVDPADGETMFKNDSLAPERPAVRPLLKANEVFNRPIGIVNLQGDEWRRARRAVQPSMMRPKTVATYTPSIDVVSKDFIDLMRELRDKDGEIPDFQHQIYKWALESVCKVTLDTRLGCLEPQLDPNSEAQRIINAADTILETLRTLMYSLPIYKYVNTPTWKRFLHSQDTLFRITKKYVEEAIARARASEDDESGGVPNLLQSLISREELAHDEIISTLADLIMGGIDTTSHSLVFNLYTLATNLDKQEKLHEEIVSTLPSTGEITEGALANMSYLNACLKETIRIYPILMGNLRKTSKDLVLSGYNVPAGTLVRYLNISGMLEEYCPEPEKFIPERWIRGDQMQGDISPFMVLPFGHGPRMCLGKRIAQQELRVIIIKLLQNFHITWKHGKMGMIMRTATAPDQPARFTFTDRN